MLCFRYPVNQSDYEQIAKLLCNPYAVFYWTEGKQLTVSCNSTCQETTNQGNRGKQPAVAGCNRIWQLNTAGVAKKKNQKNK